MGAWIYTGIWASGSGGCKILYDHSHMYDVVLQSDTCDLSDPFSGIWTDRSLDRHVCRLGYPEHYLLRPFPVRQMDGKTCDIMSASEKNAFMHSANGECRSCAAFAHDISITKVFRKINVFLKTFFVIM